MTFENVLYCIHALKNAGAREISLSGGEPFLHPDLEEIVKEVDREGMKATILTNGWFSPSWLSDLSRSTSIQISLDGANSATHDSFRGVKGSFQRAISLAKNLKNEDFEVFLATTLHKNNIGEIRGMVEIASGLGCPISGRRLIPSSYHNNEANSLYLNSDQCARAFLDFQRFASEFQVELLPHDPLVLLTDTKVAQLLLNEIENSGTSVPIGGCSAGLDGFFVSVSGNLQPCPAIPMIVGNIFHDNLMDVWRNSPILSTLRNRELLTGKCHDCVHRNICGGCRAHALAQSGDIMAGDPVCWKIHPQP